MFGLVEMKQVVRIKPSQFHKKLHEAITEELNRKFSNKVVLNVGLCITLFDITKLGDSHVLPGDGSSHTMVHFRYIYFRPFLEEVLIGRIKACSREGIYVTLDFFDDIIIPPESLQHPSHFDETEQLWVWEYEDDQGNRHKLSMELGDQLRFRVTANTFTDTLPSGPEGAPGTSKDEEKKIPYLITGTINEPGLGMLTWWENQG